MKNIVGYIKYRNHCWYIDEDGTKHSGAPEELLNTITDSVNKRNIKETKRNIGYTVNSIKHSVYVIIAQKLSRLSDWLFAYRKQNENTKRNTKASNNKEK